MDVVNVTSEMDYGSALTTDSLLAITRVLLNTTLHSNDANLVVQSNDTTLTMNNGSSYEVGSQLELAGDLAFPPERIWVAQGARTPLLSPSELTIVLLVTAVASISFLIVIILVIFTTKRRHVYHIIPSSNDKNITNYDYIYKPLIGSLVLDGEYENTFVGVSIPLLHDNTKI